MTRRQAVRVVSTLVAAAAWTALAMPFLAIGAFVSSDTSCDGGELRADPGGVMWVAVTVAVWVSPFVAVAAWRRSVPAVVAGVIALACAVAVVAETILRPGEFCF
ncbi:hypothetical protein ACXVUM_07690 [Williamsia sp. SKLECPSW1]